MTQSGVNPKLYSAYSFGDHIWSRPATRRDDLLELAQRCVKIDGKYWFKLPDTEVWVSRDNVGDAIKQAMNTSGLFNAMRHPRG